MDRISTQTHKPVVGNIRLYGVQGSMWEEIKSYTFCSFISHAVSL